MFCGSIWHIIDAACHRSGDCGWRHAPILFHGNFTDPSVREWRINSKVPGWNTTYEINHTWMQMREGE
jgi:hypothetical protein